MASHAGMVPGPGTRPGTDHDVESGHNHPTEGFYVRVAIVLTIVTAIEVAIFYIDFFSSVLVPLLLVLSAGKFVAVVGYFMHLKFDDKRLTWIFASGLALALAVFFVVFAAMHWHKITEYTEFIAPVWPD